MSSLRRIEASRRNGARSRGPKTPAGKSRSSANAIRHGLLAERVVLSNESEENFEAVLGQYLDKFAPRDGVEFGMVEEMVASYWRLHRAMAIEKYLFDKALDTHPEGDDLSRLGRAWSDIADSPSLQNLLRYQSNLHRMHQRALHNLLLLRELKPDNTELPKEPSPISEQPVIPPPSAPEPPRGAANVDAPPLPVEHTPTLPVPRAAVRGPRRCSQLSRRRQTKSVSTRAKGYLRIGRLERAARIVPS